MMPNMGNAMEISVVIELTKFPIESLKPSIITLIVSLISYYCNIDKE